jgi:hypothetical protein
MFKKLPTLVLSLDMKSCSRLQPTCKLMYIVSAFDKDPAVGVFTKSPKCEKARGSSAATGPGRMHS